MSGGTTPKVVAVVVAAGAGTRMGGEIPKQFLALGGRHAESDDDGGEEQRRAEGQAAHHDDAHHGERYRQRDRAMQDAARQMPLRGVQR